MVVVRQKRHECITEGKEMRHRGIETLLDDGRSERDRSRLESRGTEPVFYAGRALGLM